MRLATVRIGSHVTAARLEGDELVPLPYADVVELLQHDGWRELAEVGGEAVPLDEVRFLPLTPRPDKIVCVGRNYREHVAETGNTVGENPMLFNKYNGALIGAYDEVEFPHVSDQLDWECELGVVIGKAGRDIAEADALDHIAGYTVTNDVTVRDWQRRTAQWMPGKSFEKTTPVGPYLVTPDELPPAASGLRIQTIVDGEVMQDSTTDLLIFSIPRIINEISTFITLLPGDLILTGTPSGVGNARDPKVFLKPGQVMETVIEGVGTTVNKIGVPSA